MSRHGVMEEATVTLMALHGEAPMAWQAQGKAAMTRSNEEGRGHGRGGSVRSERRCHSGEEEGLRARFGVVSRNGSSAAFPARLRGKQRWRWCTASR